MGGEGDVIRKVYTRDERNEPFWGDLGVNLYTLSIVYLFKKLIILYLYNI